MSGCRQFSARPPAEQARNLKSTSRSGSLTLQPAFRESGPQRMIIDCGTARNRLAAFRDAIAVTVHEPFLAGIVIFLVLSLVSHLVLRRWHESALKQEG